MIFANSCLSFLDTTPVLQHLPCNTLASSLTAIRNSNVGLEYETHEYIQYGPLLLPSIPKLPEVPVKRDVTIAPTVREGVLLSLAGSLAPLITLREEDVSNE